MQVDDGVGGLTTQIQNRYTHGGQVDELLSLEVFDADGMLDQSYTYHADHLGSIRFVTDSVGTIVNAYEYDSYGRPGFELEQVAQPFRYTGREWDAASEFYHYRARKYDPETGRFAQRDPFGFDGQDFNIFRYAQGNPLRYSDPYVFSATETAGLNSNNSKKGAGAKNLGDRINCLFGGLGAVLQVAQGGDLKKVTPNLADCSAKGYKVSKKRFTSCKVASGVGPVLALKEKKLSISY